LKGDNLRLEREVLNLRVQMSDRRLPPAQQKSVAEKLKPYAGISVGVFQVNSDAETFEIAKEIVAALGVAPGAGWNVLEVSGAIQIPGNAPSRGILGK
jgi:hypothetical protein